MICQLLAESDGQFLWPAEFEKVADLYFEHLKQFQNPGKLALTAPCIYDTNELRTFGEFSARQFYHFYI